MTIETTASGTMITGEEDIRFAQMLAQRGALRLEVLGMTRRGRSVYSIVKEQYGLKGSKQKVLDQFCELIEEKKRERATAENA